MVCVSLSQVDDVLWRAEVWEENHVCSNGGRSSRPPLVSLTSDTGDHFPPSTPPPYSYHFYDIYFYFLNILLVVMVWWSLSSSVSSCCVNFTCIQSLCQEPFIVNCNVIYLWLAASNCLLSPSFLIHAIMLDILLCHVSTNHAVIALPSSSSFHSSPFMFLSRWNDTTTQKMLILYFLLLQMQLREAALLRREEEETLDQDLASRLQQLWADAPGACDQTTNAELLLLYNIHTLKPDTACLCPLLLFLLVASLTPLRIHKTHINLSLKFKEEPRVTPINGCDCPWTLSLSLSCCGQAIVRLT